MPIDKKKVGKKKGNRGKNQRRIVLEGEGGKREKGNEKGNIEKGFQMRGAPASQLGRSSRDGTL